MKASDILYHLPSENDARNKVVLVGMLEDGPTGVGFSLATNKNAIYTLGDNEMTRSHTYLTEIGVALENILFYRLNGIRSTLNLSVQGEEFFRFSSIGANDRDNAMTVTVSSIGITLLSHYDYLLEDGSINEVEQKMYPNFKRTYLFSEYPYLSELAGIINQDATLGLIDLVANESLQGKCSDWFTATGEFPLSGGNAEANMCTHYEVLPDGYETIYWPYFEEHVLGESYDGDSYSNLASIEAEVLYFADIQIDTLKEVVQLAGKLAEQITSHQNILCTAVFHASPVPGKFQIADNEYFVDTTHYYSAEAEAVVDYVPYIERDAYLDKLAQLYSDDDREPTYWQHVQIIVGESRSGEDYLLPGSLYHTGIYLQSPFYLSLSNQELTGFNTINVELPKSLIASLQAKGYTCIVPSIRKNAVCAYVQNMAIRKGTLLENFNNQRLVSYITKDIKLLLEESIGKPNSLFVSSGIAARIESYLSQFVKSDSLSGYTVALPEDYQTETGAFIEVSLSLYNEVKEIKSQLSISKEGWEVDLWSLTV